jgi:hypothetical protein
LNFLVKNEIEIVVFREITIVYWMSSRDGNGKQTVSKILFFLTKKERPTEAPFIV